MKKVLKTIVKWAKRILLFILLLIIIPSVGFGIYKGYRGIRNATLTEKEKWIEDLDLLVETMKSKHVNLNWREPNRDFDLVVEEVKNDLLNTDEGNFDREKLLMSFKKIIAFPGDGHTDITNYRKVFEELPLYMAWYKDGLYIYSIGKKYKEALGGKVLAIDNMPLKEVVEKLKPYSESSNLTGFKFLSPYTLRSPGMLYGAGITNNPDKARFKIKTQNNKEINVDFNIISQDDKDNIGYLRFDEQNKTNLPLYRQNKEKNYWFKYLPTQKVLYFKYSSVQDDGVESINDFSKRLFNFIDSNEVNKFVIDLRGNTGGNNFLNAPLIAGILERPKINRKGKLFTIIGKRTFSAAICFAEDLEMKTKTLIYGEPVGDYPNHPGDAYMLALEHSGLVVQISELFWQNSFYNDKRTQLTPDFHHELSFMEYTTGEDLLMNEILKYNKDQNLVEVTSNEIDYSKYIGRYDFSIDKSIHVFEDKGKLKMEISGKVFSDLYYVDSARFNTDILDFKLQFNNLNELDLCQPDGKIRTLKKLKNNEFKPLDLIFNGEYEKARKSYLELKKEYPNIPVLKGNNIGSIAWNIYHTNKKTKMAEELMKINIEMNPDEKIAYGAISLFYRSEGKTLKSLTYGWSALPGFNQLLLYAEYFFL